MIKINISALINQIFYLYLSGRKNNTSSDYIICEKNYKQEDENKKKIESKSSVYDVILGRKTYDWVLREIGTSHYDNGDRDVYVITRSPRPDSGRTKFYSGSLTGLIQQLRSQNGKDIYCDGGAEIVNELIKRRSYR